MELGRTKLVEDKEQGGRAGKGKGRDYKGKGGFAPPEYLDFPLNEPIH